MANRDIQGGSKVSEEALKSAKYIQDFFAKDDAISVERVLSQGSWGVTLQMIMKSSESSSEPLIQAPQPQSLPSPEDPIPQFAGLRVATSPQKKRTKITRFVLKRSLTSGGEKNITTEIDALDRLRGCMHIAQPSCVLRRSRWKNIMQQLEGPTLVMETIDNGLLWAFYEKRSALDEPLPNRLLWSLFLCLCRMVVGLAWPPRDLGKQVLGKQVHGKPTLEVIPPLDAKGERPPKSRLLHGDFHGQNIMIDTLEPLEHQSVPLLKLIDFGMSRDLPVRPNEPHDIVVKTHIRAIGEVMLGLLRGNVRGGPGMMEITQKGQVRKIKSFATDLDKLSDKYKAPVDIVAKHQDRIDNLDPEIRSLVALCVAVEVDDRPDIEDLLDLVERNAKDKKPTDYMTYKYFYNETDAAITRIVRDYMFNA